MFMYVCEDGMNTTNFLVLLNSAYIEAVRKICLTEDNAREFLD